MQAEEDDFISKTRRKRQMTDLQKLGAELVKLSPEVLARIEMPAELREAVTECKRFSKHEAVRRQMQYIGRIMRDLDAAPIAEQLAALQAPSRRQTALFHVAERWREEMLREPAALERFAREFPQADAARMGKLVSAAREEQRTGKAPKHFRQLFHAINAVLQEQAKKE